MTQGAERTHRPAEAKKGDELSGEVVVRAHVDQAGLTLAGKSRFLAATDRLLGGLVGIPAAYFEGIRERVEIKNSIRLEQIRVQSRGMIELLENMGVTGKVTAQRFVAEEILKQINREAVWAESDKSIRLLASPNPTDSHDGAPELEEDWINIFASYAEKASSERLRQLWGRILAGEIRKPGSFAPSTLRTISEMDAEIATAFQEVVALRLETNMLLKPSPLEGDLLLKWTFLEEVGLFQEVNGSLTMIYSSTDGEHGVITTRNYSLRITFKKQIPNISIQMVKITRVGQQIADILPWDEIATLKGIARRIAEESDGLDLGQIIGRDQGRITSRIIEVIKSSNSGQQDRMSGT